MLWVLKRTVSSSRWDGSFEHPKHIFKLMDKKITAILCLIFWLKWPYEQGPDQLALNLYLFYFFKKGFIQNQQTTVNDTRIVYLKHYNILWSFSLCCFYRCSIMLMVQSLCCRLSFIQKMGQQKLSRDMWFPTMWHFDKCRLRRVCAAFF